MAAYAETTTLVDKQRLEPGGLSICTFTVNLTNYNSTLAAITDITDHFQTNGIKTVICDSVSDEGYWQIWVSASNAFKAFKAAATEQDDDTDHGQFNAIVIGYIKQ